MTHIFQTPPWPDLTSDDAMESPSDRMAPIGPSGLSMIQRTILWVYGKRNKSENERRIDWGSIRRVLIIRLDGIGDVVMTSPFLRELRRAKPDVWISLVANSSVENLVQTCPMVNEVLHFKNLRGRRLRGVADTLRAFRFGMNCIRPRNFDLVILPRWDADCFASPLLTLMSDARWRIGYSERVNDAKARGNRGYDAFLTHVMDRRICRHEVESNLDLLRCLGISPQNDRLESWETPEDASAIEQFLGTRRMNSEQVLVALAPGAGAAEKIWPLERFAELGRWLANEYNAGLVIVGGKAEETVGRVLETRIGQQTLSGAGVLTLRETASLLRKCALLVGNDTGSVHLAVAAQVPTVVISPCSRDADPCVAQSPARFAPWGVPHRVVQPERAVSPCVDQCVASVPHCILGVSVADVQAAVRELMALGLTRNGDQARPRTMMENRMALSQ